MAPDRRLTEAFRGVAEALLPDTVLTQERAVGGALNPDSTWRPDAIVTALPWQRADVPIPGTVAPGPATIQIPFPQGAQIRHVGLSARVAPSGGQFLFRLSVDGASETFSLQPGTGRVAAGASLTVPPIGWLVGDVLTAGGVQDVLISLHYTTGATP